MPQDKERKVTPAMKALKSVGPSIGMIGKKLGTEPIKKKKKPIEERPWYSPSRNLEEIGSNLSSLRYLNPSNRPKR